MSSAATTRTKVTHSSPADEPCNDRRHKSADTNQKPRSMLRGFVISGLRRRQVRVRIRIMKLSKLSSATCIQASDSLR